MLESAYQKCLAHELRKRDIEFEEHVRMPIVYDGVTLDHAYEADLILNGRVIIELKAITTLHPIHETQLLSYLKLSGLTVGLLINFHERHLRDGIRRVVNQFRG